MELDGLASFVAAVIRSGAVLLPATLGAIVTEKSGVVNLGVEGVMVFGAMAAYGVALTTGNPLLGVLAACLLGGLLCVTHAWPIVWLRAGLEQQFVLGLILVFLGDSLSRLFGREFVNRRTEALDARLNLPGFSDLPFWGEALFQQRHLVYAAYGLALVVWLLLSQTRPGLQLRAIGEDPATADAAGLRVSAYRFWAVVAGGMLMGLAGAILSLSIIGAWTEGLTGGRGWIALGLVTFANWHPLLAIGGTLLFGGFEAAQFRLPAQFPGAQYLWGIVPYLAPIVSLPLISSRLSRRRSGAPAGLGRAYRREERG